MYVCNVCMYVCTYVCMYLCMYMSVCLSICWFVCLSICMYANLENFNLEFFMCVTQEMKNGV